MNTWSIPFIITVLYMSLSKIGVLCSKEKIFDSTSTAKNIDSFYDLILSTVELDWNIISKALNTRLLCYTCRSGLKKIYKMDSQIPKPVSKASKANKFRFSKSSGKVLALLFWDSRGIILINYLYKVKTLTGESALLERGKIINNTHGIVSKRFSFLQDNGLVYKTQVALNKHLGSELVEHPLFLPVSTSVD